MESQTNNLKFKRRRKFLMVLPLLVLPFLTLMFWVLGGGKKTDVNAQAKIRRGFNLELPDPYLKEDEALDKLSYYEKAASDSAKIKKLLKNDPYYKTALRNEERPITSAAESVLEFEGPETGEIRSIPQNDAVYNDPNEARVYEKLEQLDKALREAATLPEPATNDLRTNSPAAPVAIDEPAFLQLEQMMHDMHQTEADDPELQRLDDMLEKILDIQHPDRVQEKLRQVSEQRKGEVYAVSVKNSMNRISLIDPGAIVDEAHLFNSRLTGQGNAFYSFDNLPPLTESTSAIEAVIHKTQTVVNGATVKLRLVNDVFINGVLIPKDNFLFGIAALNGERLRIKINSIRFENSLFPVSLSVYDMDGLDGIYIPGAITRDVAKQSTDRAVQNIGLMTLDPSIEAQAAGAGIEAAQSLLSKKIKLVKVTVKAGYQVLLFDEKQRH